MKRILFCGSYIPKEDSFRIKNPQEASNNFQHEFINYLEMYAHVDVLSYICFPVDDWCRIKKSLQDIGMRGVFKVKNIIGVFRQYYREFVALLRKKPDKVIVYNMNYMYSFIWMLCRLYRIKCSLIIADFTPAREESTFSGKAKAILCGKQLNCFNEQIVLSPELYKQIKNESVILLQGGINPKKYMDFSRSVMSDKMKIVFSGALERSTGIDVLLNQFFYVKNDKIKLIISGNGSLKEDVIEATKKDSRIEYRGFLKEAEYLELLKESNVLINPRNMELLQSKNNFPSKILEYLATGRPIISTCFSGYEYFENNVFFYAGSQQELESNIEMIFRKYDTISENSFEKNREFIKEFYWENQIKKVING